MVRELLLSSVFLLSVLVSSSQAESFYDFNLKTINGDPMPFSQFKGKVVLLVNTASKCGFTPQYAGLENLWKTYQGRGLVVVGVPSNDFKNQEPGTAEEIKNFCTMNYQVDFPLTEKESVTGPNAHPLYQWIAGQIGEPGIPLWNFHKILIGPDGKVVAAWPSKVKPSDPDVTTTIEKTLGPS